jgi:hypothetical protein
MSKIDHDTGVTGNVPIGIKPELKSNEPADLVVGLHRMLIWPPFNWFEESGIHVLCAIHFHGVQLEVPVRVHA